MTDYIYMDNAATSYPKPQAVYDRMDNFLRHDCANPGRSGHRMALETENVIDRARTQLARLFHAKEASRVIFTFNGTDALNIAIKGCLRDGDEVISSCLEHNSVIRPLNGLQEAGRIKIDWIEPESDGYIDPKQIEAKITERTRLIVITHASNVTGLVQPIAEIGRIARARGVLFLVDAAQTAGAFPIDVEKDCIDLLAFPGHKCLFGPPGTGGLIVAKDVNLLAFREGGTGTDSESPVQPQDYPYHLEAGTPNASGIAGLAEGVAFILREGLDVIHAKEIGLLKRLEDGLRSIAGVTVYGNRRWNQTVATLAFNIEGVQPQDAGAILDQNFQIACRPGLHCAPMIHKNLGTFPDGCLRLSPGFFNTDAQIDYALDAIRQIQREFSLS